MLFVRRLWNSLTCKAFGLNSFDKVSFLVLVELNICVKVIQCFIDLCFIHHIDGKNHCVTAPLVLKKTGFSRPAMKTLFLKWCFIASYYRKNWVWVLSKKGFGYVTNFGFMKSTWSLPFLFLKAVFKVCALLFQICDVLWKTILWNMSFCDPRIGGIPGSAINTKFSIRCNSFLTTITRLNSSS